MPAEAQRVSGSGVFPAVGRGLRLCSVQLIMDPQRGFCSDADRKGLVKECWSRTRFWGSLPMWMRGRPRCPSRCSIRRECSGRRAGWTPALLFWIRRRLSGNGGSLYFPARRIFLWKAVPFPLSILLAMWTFPGKWSVVSGCWTAPCWW